MQARNQKAWNDDIASWFPGFPLFQLYFKMDVLCSNFLK